MSCNEHNWFPWSNAPCPKCQQEANEADNVKRIEAGRKPRKLAIVKPLYESNSRDIPATLRSIADAIERNEYGIVKDVVLVMQGEALNVFHTGGGDACGAHLILACGQRKIENGVLRAAGDIQ